MDLTGSQYERARTSRGGFTIPAPEHDDDARPSLGTARSVPPWLTAFGIVAMLGIVGTAITFMVPEGRWTETLQRTLDQPAYLFAITALLLARSRARGPLRTVWALFALAITAWLAGNVIYDVRFGNGDGDYSVADAFYLLYYPLVMAGLYLLDRNSRRDRSMTGNPLDTVIVMFAAALALWVLVRESDLTATGNTSTQVLGIAYAALDLGVLWLLLFPILRGDVVWTLSRTLMSVSFLAILVADVFWVSTHFTLYDLVAGAALALLGVAALLPSAPRQPAARSARSDLSADLAVVAVGAGAVALLAFLALRPGVQADLAIAASIVLALVIVRLVLAVFYAERLRGLAERRASIDPLTGLLNHGAFEEALEREVARARRVDEPLALLVIDVDRFKDVNDLAGHRAGDRVLIDIADLIRATCRQTDLACRTGGDELAIIAPSTGLEAAGELAGRLGHAVHGIRLETRGAETRLSVSTGLSAFPDPARTARELADQADGALYAAKQGGRDRWVVFTPDARDAQADAHQVARAAAQLGARDADFRAVFTHALEPMVIVDTMTTLLDVNEAAARLAGRSREELIGRRLTEFVSESGRPTMERLVEQLEVVTRQTGEMPVDLPDGREALVEFETSRFSPHRYLVGMHDITERAQAHQQLEFSEARFRALFDSAPDAMLITDDDGLVIDANVAASRLTGLSRPELLGSPVKRLIPVDQHAQSEAEHETLQSDGVLTGTHHGLNAQGEHRVVEFSAVAHFVPGQTLSIVRDITPRMPTQLGGASSEPSS